MLGPHPTDHSTSFVVSIPCNAHDETRILDNLYGPGRTVGKMLNFGGRHIDRLLGRATPQWSQEESGQYDGRFFREPGCMIQATQRHVFSTGPEIIKVSFVCDADGDKYETYDNLYGPGRSVGKMLNFGGRHIDLLLSKATERMGYGPRVVAHRIWRRGALIEHSILHYERQFCRECPKQKFGCNKHFCRGCDESLLLPISSNEDEKRLRKDCKRLLKYAKSGIPTTQEQALDRILDLLVELSCLRDLFKDVGAIQLFEDSVRVYEKFRSGNSDPLLLSRSRKALVCLHDTKLNVLIRKWAGHGSWGTYNPNHVALWDEISTFLYDQEKAFLVIRCLRRLAPTSNSQELETNTLYHVVSSVVTSPGYFEWEECSIILKMIMDKTFMISFDDSFSILLEYAMRSVDKMPQLLRSDTFKLAMAEFDAADRSRSVNSFLLRRSLADVIVQQRGKVLSLDVLEKAYPCQLLEPLFRCLVCPIEPILAKFVTHTVQFESIPTSEEIAAYSEIARFLETTDDALQERALKYINFFLRLDTYRCEAMSQALSSTRYARTIDFEEFRKAKRRECVPMDLLLYEQSTAFQMKPASAFSMTTVPHDTGRMIEEMTYYGWIWLTLYDDSDISATGLHPLLAGHSKNGKRIYLTWCSFKVPCGCERTKFTSATIAMEEDIKLDDLRIEVTCRHGRTISKPIEVRLIVLRYAPDIFPASYGGDEPGRDATGPFSWRPLRDYEQMEKWRRLPYSVRFIPAEDNEAGKQGATTEPIASEDDESMGDTPADDFLSLDQPIRHETANDDGDLTSDETMSCSSESDDDSVLDFYIREPLPDMMQIACSANTGESDGPETNCFPEDVPGEIGLQRESA